MFKHLGRLGENFAFWFLSISFWSWPTKKMFLMDGRGWCDFLRFSVWMVTWVWRVIRVTCLKVLLSASCNEKMVWISGGRRDSPTCRIQAPCLLMMYASIFGFSTSPPSLSRPTPLDPDLGIFGHLASGLLCYHDDLLLWWLWHPSL